LMFPEGGVEDARVGGVHRQVAGAGLCVDEQHPLPGFPAVLRAVDSAIVVRRPARSLGRDVYEVAVLRVDTDGRDLLRWLEADVLPGPAGVGGLIDAIP